jgi:hypothetical protein
MRWTVALVLFFAVLFGMNGLMLYLATSGAEPIAPSYTSEAR